MDPLSEHSPTRPELDLSAFSYEDLVSDAYEYDLLHTAPPDFDQAASAPRQGVSGASVSHHVDSFQYPQHFDNSQHPHYRDIAHNAAPLLNQNPLWELNPVEFFVPTAEDQQSTLASNGESIFSDFSSPETISTCALSIQTPPELDNPLQIVQYDHTTPQRKVFRPKKSPTKPRGKEKKPRGLSARTDALKTDAV